MTVILIHDLVKRNGISRSIFDAQSLVNLGLSCKEVLGNENILDHKKQEEPKKKEIKKLGFRLPLSVKNKTLFDIKEMHTKCCEHISTFECENQDNPLQKRVESIIDFHSLNKDTQYAWFYANVIYDQSGVFLLHGDEIAKQTLQGLFYSDIHLDPEV